MSGGGKSQTSTSSVSIPPEVLARYNSVNTRAEETGNIPFQPYGGEFVAPLSQTQQAGIANINQAAGMAQPYYQGASESLLGGASQAQPYYQAATQQVGGSLAAAAPLQQASMINQLAGQQAGQQALASGTAQSQPVYNTALTGLGNIAGVTSPLQAQSSQNILGAMSTATPMAHQAIANIMGAQGQAQPYMGAAGQALGAAASATQPIQQEAYRGIGAAQAAGSPYQELATQYGLAGARQLTPEGLSVDRYMSPYMQSVAEPTMRALRQQQQMEQQSILGDQIKGGAFGGDRGRIAQAVLAQQQGLATAKAMGDIYQQGYGQAVSTAQQQQGLQLAAEQANRLAQQQAAQQMLGIGQQGFGQNLAASQQRAALGQQLFGQGLGMAQQQAALGQQAFNQAAQTSQQQAALSQLQYGQQMGAAQAQQTLAQQLASQGLGTAQAQAGIGQQLFGQGAQAAQQLYGMGAGTAAQQAALAQQQYAQQMGAAQQLQGLGQGLYGMGAGVSQGLTGIGGAAQQAALQGGQAQLGAGQLEQQTRQAENQAYYNQFLQQQGYPYQVAQFLANVAMGTGALSGSTTTTTQPSSFFSDKRLKDDIEPIGKTYDGQDIVRYRYKGEPATRIGLVAQDVEKKHPEAVGLAGGYKTVDYDKATDAAAARAPKAYGGGLNPWGDASAYGGSVFREDAGRGYAVGGAPGGDDVLAQINALVNSHQGMFPYGKAGMYGSGMGKAGPYGSTLMPAPNRSLMRAENVGTRPVSAMEGIESTVKRAENIKKIYESGKKGAEFVKTESQLSPTYTQAGQGPTQSGAALGTPTTIRDYLDSFFGGANQGAIVPEPGMYRGGLVRGSYAMGGLPYSQAEDEYVPEDISKPKELPKLATAQTPQMKQESDAEKALKMAASAAAIYAAFGSDRRLKENIEAIGKTNDGQTIYRYNYKGDPRTQIGLIAQEVEKHHPDAVGLAGTYKTVDYKKATEDAIKRASGGLVPRQGYQQGGDPVEDEVIHGYSRRAIEDMFNQGIIPIESRGQQFDAQGQPLRSRAGATGIAQVMPSTGPEAARLAGLEWDQNRFERDPEYNRDLGLAYFTHQLRQHGDPLRAAAAYNAGPSRLQGALDGGEDYFSRLPTETQDYLRRFAANNPGGLIPPALMEQVFGRGSATAQSGLAPRSAAQSEQQKPAEKDWMARNESWVIPLVTGLGTMASSPSRYLGSAILQGLMGAGQGYQQTQAALGQRQMVSAQEAQTRMLTEETAARIAGTAYNPQLGRVRVMRPDGRGYQFITLSEYTRLLREGRPPQTGPSAPSQTQEPPQVQIPGATAPSGAAAPPGAVQREDLTPPATQRQAQPPAPQGTPTGPEAPESPIYSVLPREIQQSSASLAENIMNTPMGALRADQARNIWPDLSRSAAAQYATVPERNAFAGALSGIAEEGPLSSGPFGQQIGVPAVSWANSLLRSLGISYQIRPEELATAEEARKMVMRSGIQQQAESGSRAFQELRAVLEAVPNAAMSRQAQADLVADTYISSQRQIDLNNFANLYRENLRANGLMENQIPFAGEQVETDFARRQNPIYAEEKRILSDMFMARTADGKPLIKELIQAGGVPPPAVIEALERRYGPRGLEVLRYFRGS